MQGYWKTAWKHQFHRLYPNRRHIGYTLSPVVVLPMRQSTDERTAYGSLDTSIRDGTRDRLCGATHKVTELP